VFEKNIAPDEPQPIVDAVLDLKRFGCELILTTGGLPVDPDGVTKLGIM